MESHRYGFYPSFIGMLSKEMFFSNPADGSQILAEILSAFCTKDVMEAVVRSLELWSGVITLYPCNNEDQYGPFRIGPAYPMCLKEALKPPEDPAYNRSGIYYAMYAGFETSQNSPFALRLPFELENLKKRLGLWEKGLDLLRPINTSAEELERLINLGEFIRCCIITTIHLKEFYRLKNRLLLSESRKEMIALVKRIEAVALKEIANAQCSISYAERDSRLGWEPSMEYLGDAEHIRWKIRQVTYMINVELKQYKMPD